MKAIAFGCVVLLAGCGGTPAPTNEEAAEALADIENRRDAEMFMRLLDKLDAAADEPADAGTKPSPRTPTAGTPKRLPDATVESLKCTRVDKSTHDCDVLWRTRRSTAPTQGVYRFVRGADQKWTAYPR